MGKLVRGMLIAVAAGAAVLAAARGYAYAQARAHVVRDAATVPQEQVAIVFGAGLNRSGGPTPMLYDRIASAVDLYRQGKVGKLLMSGDNTTANYDEPSAMKRTAVQLGVPETDILLDLAGASTYDTCYRAREVFGLSRAVLVTQAFHLDRALMTCQALGVQGSGFVADRRSYLGVGFNWFREVPATAKAAWDVFVAHPKPASGDKIRID